MKEIILKNIKKSYGGRPVLKNLSMRLTDEEGSALMGESGIGKTTLFRLISGLEEPEEGEICFDGFSGERPRLSVVFQEDRLFEHQDAVRNICAVTKGLERKAAEEALSEIGPDIDIRTPAGALSGGQKRRIAVIRALLHPSDILIMDEPFTGLDAETKERTAGLISRELRGRLLIISTHDEAEARLLSCKTLWLGEEMGMQSHMNGDNL